MDPQSPITESTQQQQRFNILELYSGIGGFHYALKDLLEMMQITDYQITAADINTTANAVYRHNHLREGKHVLLQRNIKSFTAKELDQMRLNLITMSPPCQPFSRLGLKRDLNDHRCDSFQHLMSTLPLLSHPPEFIMLENVKGFDTSEAHELLIETLIKCNYQFAEFLLSPTQFSIPNSRQRFVDHISLCSKSSPTVKPGNFCSTIEPYLDSTVKSAEFEPTSDTLLRYHALFDLVTRHSTSTNCFTKSYAHRIEGCGSILMTASNLSMDGVYAEIAQLKSQQQTDDAGDETSGKIVQLLRSLGLRFFTPREVANLMSFPPNFEFPPDLNLKQQYRVLGNSVNVLVCQYLLRILLGLRPGVAL
ncbi:tRNA (cytosine-5-)-methyltransferase [Tyrophagus putrescentiae]|nr:tRNA (cytosine-5-)-methyltransferase [Tyrophagus putrescentiae]